ncbi:RNA-binding protein [Mycoplasma seminis]|uniref:RNA-binding protein n=1 Tax=Mycoplasma seminis TaxID=512749 RepID=A0ABY9HB99_9MOLU|nr:RNA-binding protein [Mycoplasma seminis]WLP85883.1 RNA-binding protein [Mycoplasma seminis]
METKLTYKNGQVASAKVIRAGTKFVLLEDKYKNIFIIHKNEITDFYKLQIHDILKLKEIINFIVIGYDEKTNQYIGSFKRNHPNFLKSEQYFVFTRYHKNELKETKNGFANLQQFTNSYVFPESETTIEQTPNNKED